MYCVVPENIHAHPKKDQWKFQGGGGRGLKAQFLKESVMLIWNFWEGSS